MTNLAKGQRQSYTVSIGIAVLSHLKEHGFFYALLVVQLQLLSDLPHINILQTTLGAVVHRAPFYRPPDVKYNLLVHVLADRAVLLHVVLLECIHCFLIGFQ